MAEALSYFMGRDRFVWWFGVVEDRSDPEALGRVKVRVFGYHTSDKTKLKTSDLPWAFCVQPSNSASSGGIGSSPTGPIEGSWVFGFWRDPDYMQEPMVLGTLPGKVGASAAPQGSSPFDYSDEQVLPPPTIESSKTTANGSTSSFPTPMDTTDATVLVKINGQVQTPKNRAPSSPNNPSVGGASTGGSGGDAGGGSSAGGSDQDYSGGNLASPADFAPSRYAKNIADKVNQLAPDVREKFKLGLQKFLADNNSKGYDCNIAFSYRSIAQQRELYRKFKSGESKSRAASPGGSWHNYACAIDMTIYVDGTYDSGSRGTSNYTQVARAAFAPYGLENNIPNDSGHFYPTSFGKAPPQELRNNQITVAEYAKKTGFA